MLQTDTKLCGSCGAEMPGSAAFCPGCGRPMSAPGAGGKIGILPEHIAGAIAYFTFLPSVAFLFLEPYRRNRFVRFHSLQCLLFTGAALLLAVALKLAGLVLFFIPVLGPLLVLIIDVVAGLAAVFLWMVLVVKALQGEMFKLPWLGEFAEHYAAAVQAGP